MVKTNSEIRQTALAALRGNWTEIVLTSLLFIVLSSGLGITGIGTLLVTLPLEFGFAIMCLLFVRGQKKDLVETLFTSGFKPYGRVLVSMLLVALFTVLWTLLFIIPGIIKSYSYRLTPYLVYENPELTPREAIRLSQKMMKGYKMKMFLIDLGFVALVFLSFITLGIALLWLFPFFECTYAAFYEEMKADWAEKQLNGSAGTI